MTRRDRPKKGSSSMNPKITYALLGVIFVVMALIIVNQVISEPELETEVVTAPEAPAPEQEAPAPAPSATERQPVKEPAATPKAPQTQTALQEQRTPPGEKPATVPAQEAPAPAANETQAAQAEQTQAAKPKAEPAPAGKLTQTVESANQTAAAPEQTAEKATETAANETAAEPAATGDEPEDSSKAKTSAQAAQDTSQPAASDPITPAEREHENILRLVTVERRGGAMVLRLQADKPIGRYKYFTLTDPSRLVVDLIGEWEQKSPGVKVPQNELFRRIRFGRHDNKLRIVADLATTDYTEPVVVQDPPTELVVSLRKK